MQKQVLNVWNAFGGLVLFLAGAGFALGSRQYDLGTINDMGPGFLPMAFGILLACLGLVETIQSIRTRAAGHDASVNWRATAWVSGALLAFAVLIETVGFVPAVFAASFLAMMSEKRTNLLRNFIFSIALAAVAALLFIRLLSVSATAFGG